MLWLFGVRPGNAYVDLDGEHDARFRFYRVRTPMSNVASWRIEGEITATRLADNARVRAYETLGERAKR